MAKKKKTGKKSKPAARYNLKRGASAGTKKALATRKAGPRSQTLPEMGQVRSTRLDNLCEAINEDRQAMNAAKGSEAGNIQAALREMQRATDKHPNGRMVYKHGGVELARVPGADKLRVRLSKDDGDADETTLAGRDETDNDQVGDERREDMADLGADHESDGASEVH